MKKGSVLGVWKDQAFGGDGMRATFLKTGTVNREALDLDALDEKPVTYAGGNGIVLDLAYHPVLPLAACVGADFSIVCDRETGKLQADALKSAAADLQSARFQHVWFSADGKGLLFDMIAAGGEHLLYRAALNLSPADVNKVGNRLANMASLGHELLAEQLPAAGKGSVPLAEIDAFRGDRGREMSPAEIGRALTDAVVIVQNERGSGTGFVVGKSGYVLTCAHCVRQAETNSVSYRASEGGKASMKSVPAKVLYCDNHTDVALLKIDSVGPLPAVCLAVGEKVESGERVTIIGNPGLGGKILDYTMTEGIVSNARRELRHQT